MASGRMAKRSLFFSLPRIVSPPAFYIAADGVVEVRDALLHAVQLLYNRVLDGLQLAARRFEVDLAAVSDMAT